MKHLKTFLLIFVAFATLLGTTSCDEWNNQNSYDGVSWGTIAQSVDPTYPFQIVADDTVVFFPSNYVDVLKEYTPVNGQRIAVYYNNIEATNPYSYPTKTIEVVQISDILTKSILNTSQIDTIANDKINPASIWYGGGGDLGEHRYLNIKFQVMASGMSTHTVYLVKNLNNEVDEDGYYHLEFRHDSRGDSQVSYFSGYVSFILDEDSMAEGVKGLKIYSNTISEGEKTFTLDYPSLKPVLSSN
ncbi:MAG: NigD-like N-terminal domain-containing protein [Bacteroidales bacterium]|nr:NigD-like N-terminal domain-containing protein [Bacteroidales bacterium]